VDKLINQCNANVNSGDITRPSVLDILQFNREQQKSFDKTTDDLIEQMLLSHNALNRCQIQRIVNKRKAPDDNDESAIANLACLKVDLSMNSQIRTAKNYARVALSLENRGEVFNAEEYYKRAMNSIPNDTLDWSDYAFNIAIIYMTRGENQLALDLLQQALIIRNRYENETEQINKIQHAIDNIQKK
jgi:tetratricopeptide (TPR) repeat protein